MTTIDNQIKLIIQHAGQATEISLEPDATLLDLQLRLTLPPFSIALPHQKLLSKGKQLANLPEESPLGLKDGSKVMLIGTAEGDVDKLQRFEAALRKREQVIATRQSAKVRSILTCRCRIRS